MKQERLFLKMAVNSSYLTTFRWLGGISGGVKNVAVLTTFAFEWVCLETLGIELAKAQTSANWNRAVKVY